MSQHFFLISRCLVADDIEGSIPSFPTLLEFIDIMGQ